MYRNSANSGGAGVSRASNHNRLRLRLRAKRAGCLAWSRLCTAYCHPPINRQKWLFGCFGERWLSGRKRRLAKPESSTGDRRFESCPLRSLRKRPSQVVAEQLLVAGVLRLSPSVRQILGQTTTKSVLSRGAFARVSTAFRSVASQFGFITILVLSAASAAEAKVKETTRRHYQAPPRRRVRGS